MNLYNPPAGTIRASLRYPAFRWLLSGLAVSQTGDWLYNLALVTMVYEGTHSAMWVGITTAAWVVPLVALGPLGGVGPALGGVLLLAGSPALAFGVNAVQDQAQACQMAQPPILRPPHEESHDHNPA